MTGYVHKPEWEERGDDNNITVTGAWPDASSNRVCEAESCDKPAVKEERISRDRHAWLCQLHRQYLYNGIIPPLDGPAIPNREATRCPGCYRVFDAREIVCPRCRATPNRVPDDILTNFKRWEPYMTPAERGAVCAVLFLSAREPSAEDIRRGQELAKEHGW